MLSEEKLRQLFKNRSDCYIDMEDDSVVQGLSEDGFIDILSEVMRILNPVGIIGVGDIASEVAAYMGTHPTPMDIIKFDSVEAKQRLTIELNEEVIKPITRRERRLTKKKKK